MSSLLLSTVQIIEVLGFPRRYNAEFEISENKVIKYPKLKISEINSLQCSFTMTIERKIEEKFPDNNTVDILYRLNNYVVPCSLHAFCKHILNFSYKINKATQHIFFKCTLGYEDFFT